MRKKSLFLVVILSLFLITLCVGVADAFSFSDWLNSFFDKITGKATSDPACIDTDNGRNYTARGSISGLCLDCSPVVAGTNTDMCTDSNNLMEFYCTTQTQKIPIGFSKYVYITRNGWIRETVNCPNGCSNGACFQVQQTTCTDSDGGKDYNTKGTITIPGRTESDFCQSDVLLREWFCGAAGDPAGILRSEAYTCPNGCKDGACIQAVQNQTINCKESDGGINYEVKGVACMGGNCQTDYCIDNNLLLEYYIENNDANDGVCSLQTGISTQKYTCPNGCSDGACLTMPQNVTPTNVTCTDTDNGKDYYKRGSIYGICGDCKPPVAGSNSDMCDDTSKLREFYCINSTTWIREVVNCQSGCSNGACVQVANQTINKTITCTDSDNGKNYYVRGNFSGLYNGTFVSNKDECLDPTDWDETPSSDWLGEGYCENNVLKIERLTCPNGCSDGTCSNLTLNITSLGCSETYQFPTEFCTSNVCGNDKMIGCPFLSGNMHLAVCNKTVLSGSCSINKSLACQNRTWVSCPYGCSEGECNQVNIKDLSRYSNKEAFLISDKNWKDVLPLVPVTTWTQQSSDEGTCQGGYGTSDNVCVYPNLIYHEDETTTTELGLSSSTMKPEYIKINGMTYDEWQNYFYVNTDFNPTTISLGQESYLYFNIYDWKGNNTPEANFIKTIEVLNWPYKNALVLKEGSSLLINVNTSLEMGYLHVGPEEYSIPIFIFKTLMSGAFDADSIIYFMQQYLPNKVTIIGPSPQELDNLLIALPDLGAGLTQEQVQRISVDDYLSYWKSFKDIVYVKDNYEMALMASTYASLINAPLIIEGTDLDTANVFAGRNVICIGSVIPAGRQCNEQYSLEQLQQKYVDKTKTDKIILVNPNDLSIKVDETFSPEKSGSPISELYSKTSLSAPILASAKHEIITFVHSYDYKSADTEFTNQFLRLYNFKQSDIGVECKYGDSCSSKPDVYEIPIKESVDDEVSYKFDISNINFSDINSIWFQTLVTNESCYKSLNDDLVILINNNEYKRDSKTTGYSFCAWAEGYVQPGLFITKEELDNKPLSSNILDVNIKVPGCKIIRRLDLPESYYNNILYVTLKSGTFKYYLPIEETRVINEKIIQRGLAEGNTAIFNFENLNPSFKYSISPYLAPLLKSNFNITVKGSQIIGGKLKVEVKANSQLLGKIVPLKSVKLFLQSPKDYYLTIFSSPDAIQMTHEPISFRGYGGYTFRYQLDGYYKTLLPDYDPMVNGRTEDNGLLFKLLTGRIFGITLSDISSYTARDLFFDKIPKDKSASFIFKGTSFENSPEQLIQNDYAGFKGWHGESNVYREFPGEIYKCYSYNDPELGCDSHSEQTKQSYYNSYFTLYDDHGSYNWAFVGSWDLANKYLQPKTNYIVACDTCDFVNAKDKQDTKNLFCMQNLRRGSLGYIGAQSLSLQPTNSAIHEFVPSLVIKKETIGKAWQIDEDSASWGWQPYFVLIGDPTLKPIYWGVSREW